MDTSALSRLPDTDPTPLLRPRDGIYAVDLLAAAVVEFRVFDLLQKNPLSLAGLCESFGWADRPADVLVTLLKSYGLISENSEGVFSVTRLSEEHFCADSPWSLTSYYRSLRDRPVVGDFIRVLKSGKPANWSGLDEAEEDWHGSMLSVEFAETFTSAMDCRGFYLGKRLADVVPELAECRRLLDAGGGSGVYSAALAANFEGLSASVLEQEPVAGIARRRTEERGFAYRVDVVVGDLFETWPEGYDAHLFSNVLHDWDVPEVLSLLRRSRAAFSEGDLILIHDAFLNREKNGPKPVAEYSCILAHSTQGRCYSVGEMESFLAETGFAFVAHRDTGGDRGVILGRAI